MSEEIEMMYLSEQTLMERAAESPLAYHYKVKKHPYSQRLAIYLNDELVRCVCFADTEKGLLIRYKTEPDTDKPVLVDDAFLYEIQFGEVRVEVVKKET